MGKTIIKAGLQVRRITFAWSTSANSVFNKNIYDLINEDLPAGRRCLGIVGYSAGQNQQLITNCRYEDSAYAFEMRNLAGDARSGTAVVYYLYTSQ